MAPPELTCRTATPGDLHEVLRVFSVARDFMAASGNPGQWGRWWPPAEVVADDIEAGRLVVVESGGRIRGCFALVAGEDPTYRTIDGSWLSDGPYLTIHRLASDGTARGVFGAAVAHALAQNPHVRCDTHERNAPMLHCLEAAGFSRRGTIVVEDGTGRIAFERV